jgi:hypothetical protein
VAHSASLFAAQETWFLFVLITTNRRAILISPRFEIRFMNLSEACSWDKTKLAKCFQAIETACNPQCSNCKVLEIGIYKFYVQTSYLLEIKHNFLCYITTGFNQDLVVLEESFKKYENTIA